MNKQRYLFVISGPSGSGKDSVMRELQKKHKEVETTISATTRAMRGGEKDGEDYYFLTKEEFEQKLAAGEVLEHTQYCGNYYGTLRNEIDRRLEQGVTTFLVIDVVGAQSMKRTYPDCTTIFVRPPSYEELSRRLHKRETEDEETIQKRLARALEEMEYAVDYDYLVINDELDDCVEEVYEIICRRQA